MSATLRRRPFDIRPEDRDYSGLAISDRVLSDGDIERSFFNGVNLLNCVFQSVKMNNTEFSEAQIQTCSFSDCNLSGSDFVDSLIEDTRFLNCAFDKGEWRDTTFKGCKFSKCNFDHTTVTLCVFISCTFDSATISSMEHRAIYFNVLSGCRFGAKISDSHFASRNFGFPALQDQGTIVRAGGPLSIEQLCLLNNIGRLRAIDVAGVAESTCMSLFEGMHHRTSTLVFFAKIVRALTDERRISSTSLIYLEQTIVRFAGETSDQDLFTAAMTAVIEIRSALFSAADETLSERPENPTDSVLQINIRFSERFVKRQVEILAETLSRVVGAGHDGFTIQLIQDGSTIIDLIAANIVSIGALLVAFNFVLRQAKITIKAFKGIKPYITMMLPIKKSKKKAARAPRRRSNVPAILRTGPVVPELAPVRAAVSQYGRVLVELDEKADITVTVSLSVESVKAR